MRLNKTAALVLRHERARRGWGLRLAAQKADLAVGTWQRLEAGEGVDYSSIVKAVEALGWPTEKADELSSPDYPLTEPASGPDDDPDPTDPGGLAQKVDRLEEKVDELTSLLRAALSGDATRLFADPDGTNEVRPGGPVVQGYDPDAD